MKKCIFVIFSIFIFLDIHSSVAQNIYRIGDRNLQVGIGLGGMSGIYGNSVLPPISIGIDWAHSRKISFGGIIGYASSENIVWGSNKWNLSYVLIGGRVAYHFLEEKDLDGYAGLVLGYDIVSQSWNGDDSFKNPFSPKSYLFLGGFLGARYYFDPQIAVFGEIGYGLGILNLGVSFKI